jgi:hypothetical protein
MTRGRRTAGDRERTSRLTIPFDGTWVDPTYLQAALEDLVDVLADVTKARTTSETQVYTWMFEARSRPITLEITVRRLTRPALGSL